MFLVGRRPVAIALVGADLRSLSLQASSKHSGSQYRRHKGEKKENACPDNQNFIMHVHPPIGRAKSYDHGLREA